MKQKIPFKILDGVSENGSGFLLLQLDHVREVNWIFSRNSLSYSDGFKYPKNSDFKFQLLKL